MYAAQAYVPDGVIYGGNLGLNQLSSPMDMCAADDGNLYILESGTGAIAVVNSGRELVRYINGFSNDGQQDSFKDAQGIFVGNGRIYIADTANCRILILDLSGKLISVIEKPESSLLDKDFQFKPSRIAIDSAGTMYVVSQGTYEGLITLDENGQFDGFIGANKINPSALDILWMKIYTKAQRSAMVKYVPVSHSSIDIDGKGFLYCTTLTVQQNGNMVQRLNQSGNDILRNLSSVPVCGDPATYWFGSMKGKSVFVDVAHGESGIFACLDSKRGRIFCYNNDGYLLYSFGGKGESEGVFHSPCAVTYYNDRILVLDSLKGSVTYFKPTEYAKLINEATANQVSLKYEESYEKWMQVLSLDSNSQLAHIAVGNVYYNEERYKEAMNEYRKGGNKALYSKALAEYRTEWIADNSNILFFTAAGICFAVLAVYLCYKKRRKA